MKVRKYIKRELGNYKILALLLLGCTYMTVASTTIVLFYGWFAMNVNSTLAFAVTMTLATTAATILLLPQVLKRKEPASACRDLMTAVNEYVLLVQKPEQNKKREGLQ